MDGALERWVPIILASLLFFKIAQVVLGAVLGSVVRPKVILILALLIVLGVLPLAAVREAVVGGMVFLYGIVHDAYTVVVGSVTTTTG